jgi:hypothetical protein
MSFVYGMINGAVIYIHFVKYFRCGYSKGRKD